LLRLQARTDRVGSVWGLLHQFGGHDHAGVDRPQRNPQLLCRPQPPTLGFAHGILIAHNESSVNFIAESDQVMLGILAQHEPDLSPGKCGADVRNAFVQKPVMPQVGMRIVRNRRKGNDHRPPQSVGGFDRDIQPRIVDAALSPLHPVGDATTSRIGNSRPANRNRRIARQSGQYVHEWRFGSAIGLGYGDMLPRERSDGSMISRQDKS
jgi:hypothetical protein